MSLDLLISGGLIVDGVGDPGRVGSVGVEGDRLRLLSSDDEPRAGRVIDATGLVVAPGFIDLHSHSGLMLLADPVHEPKIRQGVTTEVIGVDGNSYAPFETKEDLRAFARLNAGLDGIPPIAYDWDSVASYLSRFDRRSSVNVAYVIGNSALRICALGWEDVTADDRARARMGDLLREGMQEGAFGVSSGLDYPPGAYASTAELAGLGRRAAELGGFYHTHVRYQLGDRYLDPFREALEIGRLGEVPVHLTHLYRKATHPKGSGPLLDLVESARAGGLDVTFDTYPYEWSSTRLLILIPLWVQSGGPDALKERLADPSLRDRLRAEIDDRGGGYGGRTVWSDIRLGYFARPENQEYEGRTIAEVVQLRDQTAADVICDLLLSEDLRVNEVAVGPDAASLPDFVIHPSGMIGTDSVFLGLKPSPRTYGSFPRVLGQFVRDEGRLTLEEAVRKLTSAPAARLGLTDRGRVANGLKADLVIFDPLRVRSLATYDEPKRFPEGIPYVLVNGVVVVDDGVATGALPGRALRHGRPH